MTTFEPYSASEQTGCAFFDLNARKENDPCQKLYDDKVNNKISGYNTFSAEKALIPDCDENDVIQKMSCTQRLHRQGYGNTNSCHIDDDSKLSVGIQHTADRSREYFQTRIFQGVPNLDRGGVNVEIEDTITKHEPTNVRRVHNNISGTCVSSPDYYYNAPAPESIMKTVRNSSNYDRMWLSEDTRNHKFKNISYSA